MSYVNGAINGFKELTINPLKKKEYKAEFEEICDKYRSSQGIANIQFVNISLFGNVLIMALIGSLVFALPAIIPDIKLVGLMGYVMVLLYIIGPVDAIVHMFPGIIEIKVSWRRIQNFIKELETPKHIGEVPELSDRRISSLEVQDITFSYQKNEDENFTLGPVNFRLERGRILFVIGGNGSGKTTLGKLLTGLYHPENGSILVDGKAIVGNNLGNYFSTVFSDFHLFKKIYGIDEVSHEKSEDLLNLFQLTEKVKIKNHEYSTIELSNGQRKRLALLQCFLEDKPIYLFDEWAADQDPVFRKFFYHKLLPSMKDQGKIVIAITHDDHYFDVADTIIKLDTGKLEYIKQPVLTKTDMYYD
jgi:cyclic peptide transporter